jgi:D-glycero-beta-D-manno-heptose-7-phosphate kinase
MFDKAELEKIFDRFNTQTVLVIGDVMIDSYLWGKVDRISPEAPVPIVSVNKRENRLGGAANVALNLQSLGATPILCSVIGNEAKGKEFLELLVSQRLSNKGIIIHDGRITTTKFRIIGNNSQMLRVDEETDADISEETRNTLCKRIQEIILSGTIDAIIFEDYDKGVISEELILFVSELANKQGIPVVADPKKKNFNSYKNITLLKPNLKELKEGLKIDSDLHEMPHLAKAVEQLQKEFSLRMVMVTLSEYGVYICDNNNEEQKHLIPAHIRNIADVSGAGDTVISVAALCLSQNLSALKLATLANLAGGLVCEEIGVVSVKKDLLFAEALKLASSQIA